MAITNQSRAKYAKANGKTHPYDAAIVSVAQRLASGERNDSLGSKTLMYLHKNQRSAGYSGLTIASQKVKSAGESRVYFTFVSTSDLFIDSEFGEEQCIVVLAGADKPNELAALRRIKGSDASGLRSKRAGIK